MHKIYYVLERAIRSLQGLITSVVAARLLELNEFADFVFVQIFMMLLIPLSLFGVESNLIKRCVLGKSAYWVGSGAALLSISSSLAIVIYAMAILTHLSEFSGAGFYFFVFLTFPIYVINCFNQAERLFQRNFIAYACAFFIGSSIKLYLLFLDDIGLQHLFFVSMLDYALPALFLVLINTRLIRDVSRHVRDVSLERFYSGIKILYRDSFPLLLSSFMVVVFMKLDQLMVRFISTDSELARLAISSKLNEGLLIVPMVITGAIYPHILRYFKQDKDLYEKYIKNLAKKVLMASLPIYLSILLLGKFVIGVLYGEQYESAIEVLAIQSLTIFLTFFGMMATKVCTIHSLQKYVMVSNLIGLFLNFILNIFLIPLFGAEGAAVATVFTQLLTSYLFWHVHPMTRVQCRPLRVI